MNTPGGPGLEVLATRVTVDSRLPAVVVDTLLSLVAEREPADLERNASYIQCQLQISHGERAYEHTEKDLKISLATDGSAEVLSDRVRVEDRKVRVIVVAERRDAV